MVDTQRLSTCLRAPGSIATSGYESLCTEMQHTPAVDDLGRSTLEPHGIREADCRAKDRALLRMVGK